MGEMSDMMFDSFEMFPEEYRDYAETYPRRGYTPRYVNRDVPRRFVSVVDCVRKRLRRLEPNVHVAQSGSVYIEFNDSRLGQLRIGNHAEKEDLGYRWQIRTDVREYAIDESKGHKQFIYPADMVRSLCEHIKNYHRVVKRSNPVDIEDEFDDIEGI